MKLIHQSPALVLLLVVLVAAGCDKAGQLPIAGSDAAIDVSSEGPGGPADTNTDGGAGAAIVTWGAAPPPVEGDGRLIDVGDATNGFGWDTCRVPSGLALSAQGAIPTSTRGDSYLVSSPSAEPNTGAEPYLAQAYLWPETPGTAQGLWFDLTLVSGSAEGATISFYETDAACNGKRSFGTFSVATALTATAEWKTGCLDLSAQGNLEAIGVRIDASHGVLGLDALRFDKSCE